ncbi:MFS transporter [Variovorax ginsengisoli]|uniref:MFS family arabinose efflux permease n=1 Tax=Variovorax ginsengisoli TaxID=363844 RepID=A0ABT9S2V6_9BURK|nr:MFS transporter [Variovorax ginsengisoli]MDP9898688.1 putative MFS family arabinose efflux permease [Variovorax ginsengisoli]
MPRALVGLFACTSGASVANVYFAQPLLDALATDFGVALGAIGAVVTATQAGSLLALLLLVPLGDQYDRRRLARLQLAGLILALMFVASTQSTWGLMTGMLAVGLLGTAMTQGMIAYAASTASAHERGRVVGAAQAGVVMGILLSRVWSGAVADLVGWRGVYAGSAAVMAILGVLIWRQLPVQTVQRSRLPYFSLVQSTLAFLLTDRTLQVRGILALLMFGAFSIFWSSLALPLTAAPLSLSHSAVGAFGLLGAVGAFFAGRAGRWADRGWAQRTSAGALVLLLLAWIPLRFLDTSLWWLAIGILLLDVGCQALHVTNQALILVRPAAAHGRLIACYMLFYALGSGAGALASTAVYARAGWSGVCMLGASVSMLALIVWAATSSRQCAPEPSTGACP